MCRDRPGQPALKPFPLSLAGREIVSFHPGRSWSAGAYLQSAARHRTQAARVRVNGLGGMMNGCASSASSRSVPSDSPRFAQPRQGSPTVTILA